MDTNQPSYVSGTSDTPLMYKTIGQILDDAATLWPEQDAVVVCHQNIRWTYADLQKQVDAYAAGFASLGLEAGERIGIWSPNNIEWILTQFASAKAGLILVNINPAYRTFELAHALKTSGCAALVLAHDFKGSSYIDMLAELVPEIEERVPGEWKSDALPDLRIAAIIGNTRPKGALSFSDIATSDDDPAHAEIATRQSLLQPDDPINIQFTSGTTGSPKGATLSHYNIVNNARYVTDRILLTEHDRLCIPVPLYHCFGMVMGSLGCVSKGAAMVFPGEAFAAEETLNALSKERCTGVYGVPTMFVAMLDALEQGAFDLSQLRTGIMAGAPCPIEIMRRVVDEMNMRDVTICYGMTETAPVSFQSFVDDPIEKRVTTVGRVHPHLEVKIVDEAGQIAPVGQKGELCTRGYSVMRGYWEDTEKTNDAIVDGWMHTGDLATLDDEGYCTIAGRVKDMIIRGGENIYPKEVEDYLFRHPDVRDAQVFGIANSRFGEIVCAWIVPNEGASLSEEDVKRFCDGQIAHFKIPTHVRIVEALPITVTGKPQKFIMRDWMIENGFAS